MGKSGGRKKKGSSNQTQNHAPTAGDNHAPAAVVNGAVGLDSASIFLKRAHELKEEGNKRFAARDFAGALREYDAALKLIPRTHPERAIFHSNRAACLMQVKPIDYATVIAECSLALQVQPGYVKALLRRARALEAVGKHALAMQDVQVLLSADPNHGDALEIAGRLRSVISPHHDSQQDLHSRPSPAALGASAVRGAPVGGLGSCLPARPTALKKAPHPPVGASSVAVNQKTDKANAALPTENGVEGRPQLPRVVLKPSNGSPKPSTQSAKDGVSGARALSSTPAVKSVAAVTRWRPLKLVYGHDIRLAQMPVRCSFRLLREIVGKRFPMAKSVLIKYKDNDEDLVTITSTDELRLAESSADNLGPKEPGSGEQGDSVGMLRLHVVEVNPEQEPPLPEEEEEVEVEKTLEIEEAKSDEAVSDSSVGDPVVEAVENEADKSEKEASKEKSATDPECKEVEIDDWLFDFAQLFRTHVGIDPEAHMDLHEIGMELCSEALEETVTSEEAQVLFDKASLKFQEVAALAYFNWGNVDMCAARKRIPIDDSASKDLMASQLQAAYEWVKEKYSLAKEKYEKAVSIKPDFYEGLLALGQQQFEMAKLHWSFVLAKKEDLSNWDSTETLQLFESAEEKMKAATEMWEKLEEQRAIAEKDPLVTKREELIRQEALKRRGKPVNGVENENTVSIVTKEVSPEDAAEQVAVMKSQIHLFWGNMLFERSQVEFKLSLPGWKKNLDTAVGRFKLAGASETDIATVLKNHCSNEDATKGEQEKKVEDESAGEDRPKASDIAVA